MWYLELNVEKNQQSETSKSVMLALEFFRFVWWLVIFWTLTNTNTTTTTILSLQYQSNEVIWIIWLRHVVCECARCVRCHQLDFWVVSLLSFESWMVLSLSTQFRRIFSLQTIFHMIMIFHFKWTICIVGKNAGNVSLVYFWSTKYQ